MATIATEMSIFSVSGTTTRPDESEYARSRSDRTRRAARQPRDQSERDPSRNEGDQRAAHLTNRLSHNSAPLFSVWFECSQTLGETSWHFLPPGETNATRREYDTCVHKSKCDEDRDTHFWGCNGDGSWSWVDRENKDHSWSWGGGRRGQGRDDWRGDNKASSWSHDNSNHRRFNDWNSNDHQASWSQGNKWNSDRYDDNRHHAGNRDWNSHHGGDRDWNQPHDGGRNQQHAGNRDWNQHNGGGDRDHDDDGGHRGDRNDDRRGDRDD
jgi:hypothetical protein